jgi:DNA-binding SARP family transcriptional activator
MRFGVQPKLLVGLAAHDLAAVALDLLRHSRLPSAAQPHAIVSWRTKGYVPSCLQRDDGTRIQLCGRFLVKLAGRRVEGELPGNQGRLLFAYLALNRFRAVTRAELCEALGVAGSAGASRSVARVLSRLRAVVGRERIETQGGVRLVLPADTHVDVEAAEEAIYAAEAAVSNRDWARAYSSARVTLYVCERGFLPGPDVPWVQERRSAVADMHLRALECAASTALAMGGAELQLAEKHARRATELAPYRESCYRLLMEALAARGNEAEALRVFDGLRRLLHEELGTAPEPSVQAVYDRIRAQRPVALDAAPATRTFMFTDIVGSTALLEAIGDVAWHDLLAWHDAALRDVFNEHGGEEVDHTGDGFFVAFPDAGSALACAVAVQRRLQEQRRSQGFAPQVRIGLHAAAAAKVGRGYRGKGVHEAARIGASAGAGEILASVATVDGVEGLTVTDPRTLSLKGIAEPVEVVALDWR